MTGSGTESCRQWEQRSTTWKYPDRNPEVGGKPMEIKYTISARGKTFKEPVIPFLQSNFANVAFNQIDSLFGFVEPCTLYGGRIFEQPQLSSNDLFELSAYGIGLRLPLTNHMVSEEEYRGYADFLEKYHVEGNSTIVTNDKLAQWLRRDFSLFKIEASVIKNIDSNAKIDKALNLYDTVVLPMKLNEDLGFLNSIENKARVTLFANAGCALNCPSKICYGSISQINKFEPGAEFKCSKTTKEREILGMIDFDLEHLVSLGFSRFKLLRAMPLGITGY
jgi:hypothetical protein